MLLEIGHCWFVKVMVESFAFSKVEIILDITT